MSSERGQACLLVALADVLVTRTQIQLHSRHLAGVNRGKKTNNVDFRREHLTSCVGSTQRPPRVLLTGRSSMHTTAAPSGCGVLRCPSAGRHSAWFSHPCHARTPHGTWCNSPQPKGAQPLSHALTSDQFNILTPRLAVWSGGGS
jgi:hypothetical protein